MKRPQHRMWGWSPKRVRHFRLVAKDHEAMAWHSTDLRSKEFFLAASLQAERDAEFWSLRTSLARFYNHLRWAWGTRAPF